MVETHVHKRGERGRPRSGTSHRPDLSATEQILDAAARLFVERGYAATSTRAIADSVGIRQASLYYHFANKGQILEVLLMRTVEPSMRVAHYLEAATATSAARLYSLAAFDARQLFTATHNVGSLYLLPELRHELFEPFRAKRATLREVYARLIADSIATAVRVELGPVRGSRAQSSLDYLADVIFGMVESAIAIRADRPEDDSDVLVTAIAQSCLRVLGHDSEAIHRISAEASQVLAAMHETLVVDL